MIISKDKYWKRVRKKEQSKNLFLIYLDEVCLKSDKGHKLKLSELLANEVVREWSADGKLSAIKDGTKCLVKIRYKHVGEIATIFNVDKNLKIVFHKHVKGIAPGQSAVLYSGDDVIAGGFII